MRHRLLVCGATCHAYLLLCSGEESAVGLVSRGCLLYQSCSQMTQGLQFVRGKQHNAVV